MNNIFKNISLVLSVLVVSGIVAYAVLAWTEPGSPAPNGNVDAPINTGSGVQSKSGSLAIGTSGAPQQNLSVNGGMNIDQGNLNSGSTASSLTFGSASGEGIASKRTTGGNLNGLDFYTGWTNKMSITNSGDVGIGTTSPNYKLNINGTLSLGGGNANLDPAAGISLTALENTGNLLVGWNRTAGGGETDFVANRAGGGTGGFNFYDYSNAGVLNKLVTIDGSGNVVATGTVCDKNGCIGNSSGIKPKDCIALGGVVGAIDAGGTITCTGSGLPPSNFACSFVDIAKDPVTNADTFNRRVFVTSKSYMGSDIPNDDAADAACQAVADKAHVIGTFRALVYLGSKNPITTKLTSGNVYYTCDPANLVSGSPWHLVANNANDFFTNKGGNYLRYAFTNEIGQVSSAPVWTNFNESGTLISNSLVSWVPCMCTTSCWTAKNSGTTACSAPDMSSTSPCVNSQFPCLNWVVGDMWVRNADHSNRQCSQSAHWYGSSSKTDSTWAKNEYLETWHATPGDGACLAQTRALYCVEK